MEEWLQEIPLIGSDVNRCPLYERLGRRTPHVDLTQTRLSRFNFVRPAPNPRDRRAEHSMAGREHELVT